MIKSLETNVFPAYTCKILRTLSFCTFTHIVRQYGQGGDVSSGPLGVVKFHLVWITGS